MQNIDDRAYDNLLKQFDVLHRSLDSRITTRTQLYAILFSLVAVGLIGASSEYINDKISSALMEFVTQTYFVIAICIGFCVLSIQTEIINLTLTLRDIQKLLNIPMGKYAFQYNILYSSFNPFPKEIETTNIYSLAGKLCFISILFFIAVFLIKMAFPKYSYFIQSLYIIAGVNLLNSIIFVMSIYRRKKFIRDHLSR